MDYNTVFTVTTKNRWEIIAQDAAQWRVGIYNPECNHPDEVTMLEKHSCPELFICINAPCGLLLLIDGIEQQIVLNPNDAVMITEFHNGFKLDKEGCFIVVERVDFTTEYIKRTVK